MSRTVAVGNWLAVRIWCSSQEQASVNTLNYAVTAVGGASVTDQEIADYVQGVVVGAGGILPMLDNTATFDGIAVNFLNVRPLPATALSTASPTSGTGGAIGNPRQATGLTAWLTDFAGPAFRGRTYWPFAPAADDFGGGVPSTTYLTAVASLAARLHSFSPGTSPDIATLRLNIYHRAKAPNPAYMSLVVADTTRTKWATQKRRGSYGRPNVSPF